MTDSMNMEIDYIRDSKKEVTKSLCTNINNLSNEDMMVAADVIKDLSDAEKNCWEAKYCYHSRNLGKRGPRASSSY